MLIDLSGALLRAFGVDNSVEQEPLKSKIVPRSHIGFSLNVWANGAPGVKGALLVV